MSPQEKAEELINKFYFLRPIEVMEGKQLAIAYGVAKSSAIICVEQIIKAAEEFDEAMAKSYGGWLWPERYWQEVLNYLKGI